MVNFPEALCNIGSSVNIMPRVLYEKFFTHPLLETTMCLQLRDRTLSFPKGILKNIYVQVGTLYAPEDFVVIETGTDEGAPVILGRPFMNTSGPVIYASATKISFDIKGRKETFSFKNKTAQIPEQPQYKPRKRTNRRNKSKKQVWTESAKMVTAVHRGQDRQLKSPFLIKKGRPRCAKHPVLNEWIIFPEDTLRHRIRRQHNGHSHLSAFVWNHDLKTDIHSAPDGRSDIPKG